MLSSSFSLVTPLPCRVVYCARPGGVLLYSWLSDRAHLPALAERLASLPAGISSGAKVDPNALKALILIWCEAEQIGMVAAALGPRDLNIWPGHLHCEGEYIAIADTPHLSLVGLTPAQPPDWLIARWFQGVSA